MKPTSVIFIIVSVMLACIGLLVCMTASNMANDQGVALFTQTGDEENNFTTTETFDSAELKKIVLDVTDVKVNVYGGAEQDKIELINFTESTYEFTIGKSTLSLSDNAGISSIINLDTFQINFNGFRNYLQYYKYRNKQRTVNLYLTDTAGVIIIDISADSADVTVQDLYLECDYKITVGTGDVTMTNVLTSSDIIIESSDDSKIDTDGIRAREIEINTVTGYVTLKETVFTRMMEINIKNGAVDYNRVEENFAGFNVRLSAPNGTLRVWNEKHDDLFTETNYIPGTETPGTTDPGGAEEPAETDEPEETAEPEQTGAAGTTEPGETTKPEDLSKINALLITVDNGNIEVY